MNNFRVGEMEVGKMGVGEMGQIIGKMGVGEMGDGKMGVIQLKCICTSYFHYFQKTGSLSNHFSVVKNLKKKVILQILNFISLS